MLTPCSNPFIVMDRKTFVTHYNQAPTVPTVIAISKCAVGYVCPELVGICKRLGNPKIYQRNDTRLKLIVENYFKVNQTGTIIGPKPSMQKLI